MIFYTFFDVLCYHLNKYPLMTPQDCVKLLYQSEYGCGHFVDAGMAHKRLLAELNSILNNDCENTEKRQLTQCELFENIGKGRARLQLACREITADSVPLISRMFAASAIEDAAFKTEDRFTDGLNDILEAARKGLAAFSEKEARAYFAEYEKNGGGAVSHSNVYREAYHPAYRVMSPSAVRAYTLIKEIDARLKSGENLVVAIDGPAASGKSTVAKYLAGIFDCNIIHVDDFFLPFERKTPERLAEPGGNMDREKLSLVLRDAVKGEFSYSPFDCSTGEDGEEKRFPEKQLIIVEGSYSMHPHLAEYYDITAFCRIDGEEQKKRIKKRNPDLYDRFVNEWIPLENVYFERTDILKRADFIIA
ncbi:MAG: hypothetical protein E7619_06815 [Ruminococcaceae bacterium]|nr:hypothetical protein [Oscillospiraceae bacterium]